MRLGFTGTQRGMTDYQWDAVQALLKRLEPDRVIHGGCIGADWEFDGLAAALGIDREVYPSTKTKKVIPNSRYREHPGSNVLFAVPLPPLERNRVIIKHCTRLIATPAQVTSQLRSGTWATIRYARKAERIVYYVWPDGVGPSA